jgi:hypothetical protein
MRLPQQTDKTYAFSTLIHHLRRGMACHAPTCSGSHSKLRKP